MGNTFKKSPEATLDYKFDWKANTNNNTFGLLTTDWLESDEFISSYTITAGSGITIESDYLSDNNTSVMVWISGGESFKDYSVGCKITTNSTPIARQDERNIKIEVRNI